MIVSPSLIANVTPDAALAVARAVAAEVTDAVILLRVSAPRAGQVHTEWPALVWFNAAAARLFALMPEHIEDTEWFRAAFMANEQLWLSLGGVLRDRAPARAEVPFVLRSGDALPLDVTVTPLTEDASTTTTYWTVVARDALNNRTRVAHASQARRLETLGLVTGSIAHDFANLVHVIGGYTELALREGTLADAKRAMHVVRDTSERAAALARQLLQFSRRQPLEPCAVDVGELLTQLMPLLERLAGSRIRLTWSIGTLNASAHVWGHIGQLEQVLLNLVVNAREAQPGGGGIHIGLDVVPVADIQPPVTMANRPPWVVRLCVEDEGPGIPPALRDRVLDPFFTTKADGTGLGLSTVSDIVRQSRGELRLGDAGRRHGLLVEVLLPRHELTD